MNVAFIPLRGGSHSIFFKNIKIIAGKPLAFWCVNAAQNCPTIDKVVISTDSQIIKQTLIPYLDEKTFFFDRSVETATAQASTESALLEYFEKNTCDNVILIQATSPMISPKELTSALGVFSKKKFDSMFSCVRDHKFYWNVSSDGQAEPVNYDPFNRPRRQDHKGHMVENGAFYISTYKSLMKTRNRLGGRVGAFEMSKESLIEIDEPSDWPIVEVFLKQKNYLGKKIQNIKLMITDFDGVWTDASMFYSEAGFLFKKFNLKDGLGVQILKQMGIKVAVVTSENTKGVRKRMKQLQVDSIYQGVTDKAKIVKEIQENYAIKCSETAYIGDDLNDLSVRPFVEIFFSPADGVPQIKEVSDFICSKKGGEGCFREIVEI
ncbi:MAG: HAD hydrolase family protein, partial [Halobacteriovoraceae bacterium]|nr:HAD hydrolase family protein [Halobacteriovoraceae bacterium]